MISVFRLHLLCPLLELSVYCWCCTFWSVYSCGTISSKVIVPGMHKYWTKPLRIWFFLRFRYLHSLCYQRDSCSEVGCWSSSNWNLPTLTFYNFLSLVSTFFLNNADLERLSESQKEIIHVKLAFISLNFDAHEEVVCTYLVYIANAMVAIIENLVEILNMHWLIVAKFHRCI